MHNVMHVATEPVAVLAGCPPNLVSNQLYTRFCMMCLQMSYEIAKICTCEIIDDKNPQRTVFRVICVGKDGNYKNMDFETTLTASESLVTVYKHDCI